MRWAAYIFERTTLAWTAGLLVALAAAGALAWTFSGSPGATGVPGPMLVLGQLWFALLLAALVGVTWPAAAASACPRPLWRTWVGWAFFADAFGLWLIVLACCTGRLTAGDVIRLYLLLAAWLALCVSASSVLGRFGAGYAVIISGVLALILLALPVAATPVYRAVQARGGVAAADSFVPWISRACPTMGVLAATPESLPIEWPHLPVMYKLTPLGQDVPLANPRWHTQAMAFGLLAGGLAVARILLLRRPRP